MSASLSARRRRIGPAARGAAIARGTALVAAALAAAGLCAIAPATAAESSREAAEQVMRASFTSATDEEWRTRMTQDEAQALCSRHHNELPADLALRVTQAQRAGIRYPADGKLMGDWREGEKLASIGTGGHIGRIQPDPPGRKRGGNCYACHLLAPGEVAAGTIGPSLTAYAALRGNSPQAVKTTYDKIYNAQAFAACSLMPRFGHNGWLTPEEIAQLVAFLLDPQSPVNRLPQDAPAASPPETSSSKPSQPTTPTSPAQ